MNILVTLLLWILFFLYSAPVEFCALSLHDALPISAVLGIVTIYVVALPYLYGILNVYLGGDHGVWAVLSIGFFPFIDRKSTRLNSSHVAISYAVFWLKKKKRLITLSKKILVTE